MSAVLLAASAAIVAAAVLRHRGAALGRKVPGGILIGDPVAYDTLCHRLLLGSLFERIAADVAAVAPDRARVLDVGCGPGSLSIRLAHGHALDVTGLDLDPAMIERARANADRATEDEGRAPSFIVGDVASLPFPDASFDLVVSTLSVHHWDDAVAGLAEIGRVLRPGAHAIIWDLRRGLPFHSHLTDPVAYSNTSSLRVMSSRPWRWPWRFALMQRIELVRANPTGHSDAE